MCAHTHAHIHIHRAHTHAHTHTFAVYKKVGTPESGKISFF